MFTTQFEVVLVVGSFLVGTFWGHVIFTWVKGWFVREAKVVEADVKAKVAPAAATGPSGATGAH